IAIELFHFDRARVSTKRRNLSLYCSCHRTVSVAVVKSTVDPVIGVPCTTTSYVIPGSGGGNGEAPPPPQPTNANERQTSEKNKPIHLFVFDAAPSRTMPISGRNAA